MCTMNVYRLLFELEKARVWMAQRCVLSVFFIVSCVILNNDLCQPFLVCMSACFVTDSCQIGFCLSEAYLYVFRNSGRRVTESVWEHMIPKTGIDTENLYFQRVTCVNCHLSRTCNTVLWPVALCTHTARHFVTCHKLFAVQTHRQTYDHMSACFFYPSFATDEKYFQKYFMCTMSPVTCI